MSEWSNWIGNSETRRDVMTQGLLDRFTATVGGKADALAVQPGLHWCLGLPDAPMAELGEDGHPGKGGFLPPVPLPRRMWASSAVEFLAPIGVGCEIERVSTVAEIKAKSGKSGDLVFVEVDHVTSVDGLEAVRERQSIVYRAPSDVKTPLPGIEGADLSDWTTTRTLTPSETMLFRFSAMTFNSHRIHYDLPYATAEEGYPALVVHGPLTASLLLQLAAEQLELVRHFQFRGLAPAFCGQPLHLAARFTEDGLEMAAIGGDGRQVMAASAR